MPADLLVTGCYRSGTTLLEKLLHQHPSVCVASQPYPSLWFLVKQAFLDRLGLRRRYPLDHGFGERGWGPEALELFLRGHRLGAAALAQLFEFLADYEEGLWTPEVLELREQVAPGLWLDVARQLNRRLALRLGRPAARWVGSKEILCEEFTPFLLGQGHRVVVILRDPRAVITSLDYARRDNATGAHRPVLYSLRVWRKSVAYALAWESHPGFRWVRYEDLVARPEELLSELLGWLGLGPLPPDALRAGLRDQRGAPWRGNSSFVDHAGVASTAASRYESLLPPRVQEYVEALCEPEMRLLGYPLATGVHVQRQRLLDFQEPSSPPHARFTASYAAHVPRVDAELQRLRWLRRDAPSLAEAEARRWFIEPGAYRRLRALAR